MAWHCQSRCGSLQSCCHSVAGRVLHPASGRAGTVAQLLTSHVSGVTPLPGASASQPEGKRHKGRDCPRLLPSAAQTLGKLCPANASPAKPRTLTSWAVLRITLGATWQAPGVAWARRHGCRDSITTFSRPEAGQRARSTAVPSTACVILEGRVLLLTFCKEGRLSGASGSTWDKKPRGRALRHAEKLSFTPRERPLPPQSCATPPRLKLGCHRGMWVDAGNSLAADRFFGTCLPSCQLKSAPSTSAGAGASAGGRLEAGGCQGEPWAQGAGGRRGSRGVLKGSEAAQLPLPEQDAGRSSCGEAACRGVSPSLHLGRCF
ncbi:uncharacterized protein LOC116663301 [Camelus ferus]|uniref:Uncharacterized protein LOC116663301 n=1 Tax=Camelus ferus TaxID=419612 RepID=A0A8B8SYA3_CAMFR|nr:uncharacterized protein LOC116663301 [Camelus ferus]